MLEIDKNSREIAFSDDFRHIGSRKSGCFCKLIQQQQHGRDLIMFPNCEAQVPKPNFLVLILDQCDKHAQ